MIEKIMKAGEPFILKFRRKQSGVPVSIAGIPAMIWLRDKSPDGPVLASWVDGDSYLSRDDAAGLVQLTLPPSFTNGLKFKEAFADLLLMEDPEGIRSDLIKITLHRGVTRGATP